MLCEGMYRAISPNKVVLFNRRQERRPSGQRARDGVEHKTRVKGRDERNVNIETRGIFDLRYFKAIHLLTLFIGDEIDFAYAIAIRQTLKHTFETGETAALSWAVAEYFTADATGEDFSDDKRGFGLYTHFVEAIACRVVVCCDHDHGAAANVIGKVGAGHEVDCMTLDFERRISVEQHIRHGINLLLPQVTASTHVANDVFGLKHVGVEQRELADAGRCELQRYLSPTRSTSGNKRPGVTQRPDIEKRRDAGKKLILIHSAVPPAAAIGRTCAMFRSFAAIGARVSEWKRRCVCLDSSQS